MMEQDAEITRDLVDDIKRYQTELALTASARVEALQHDLCRAQEWQDWCENAIPGDIARYRQRVESEETERRAAYAEQELIRKWQEQTRARHNKFIRSLKIFGPIVLVLAWLEFLRYDSTSVGNFYYQVGSSFVHIVVGMLALAVIGAFAYFLDKIARH